jgi:putative peptide zinc metalloprotease protein
MSVKWSITLSERIQETDEQALDQDGSGQGIWESVKNAMAAGQRKPQAHPRVISRELKDRQGSYFVLKNTEHKIYIKLSPDEYRLFSQMDGQTSLEELVFEHFTQTHTLAPEKVKRLADQLYQRHMLSETPVAVWSMLGEAIQRRSWRQKLSYPARLLLTRRFSIHGLDELIAWLYRSVGWLFFTRPFQLIFIGISLLGVVAFYRILEDPRYVFLGENIVSSLALLWLAAILPIAIHELGHALTVKHFGCEVPKGGFMLFFGMPAAYVETTDIWLEPRRARLAVTWNGPYTGLILGGLASLAILLFPDWSLNNLLFKLAGFSYLTVFVNVNPLLKLDGYYLLSDALDIPSLRERSIAFVRRSLLPHLLQKKKLGRDEWVYTVFGLLSILWTIYAIYFITFFWQNRLRSSLQMLLGDGYSLLARGFSLLLLAAFISFTLLLSVNVYRLAGYLLSRFVILGGLERHARLALIIAALALGLSASIRLILPERAYLASGLLGLVLTGFAVWQIILFNRPYGRSKRGLAHMGFALALSFTVLFHLVQLYPTIQISSIGLMAGMTLGLTLAGLLLVWPPLSRLGPFYLGIGVSFGILILFIVIQWVIPNANSAVGLVIPVLVTVGALSFIALQGSSRSPAILLIYSGGILHGLGWYFPGFNLDLNLLGTLLIAGGCLHLAYARLPRLSSYKLPSITTQTNEAIRTSVEILVRRLIAQTFFESGWRGVHLLGRDFTNAMRRLKVDLSIEGNQFHDRNLPQRTVDELTQVYRQAFEILHHLASREFGRELSTLTFGYGVDLLPWQYREVIAELVLSSQPWGLGLNQEVMDAKERRRKLLKRVPLFVDCQPEMLARLADSLRTERFAAGEIVIRQGDPGDRFYIVELGYVSIWQRRSDGLEEMVHKVGPGQYFGEVALVSNAPRNASVRADTPLVLLSLGRKDFDRLVRRYVTLNEGMNKNVKYSWLLRGMPLFDELESHQLDWLVERLQPEVYRSGEIILHAGDPGDKFFIIESGEVIVMREIDGIMEELTRRGPGEYLGEIALLEDRPRTATLVAAVDSTLLSLHAEYFQELVTNFFSLGQTLSLTGSRRMTFVQGTEAGGY